VYPPYPEGFFKNPQMRSPYSYQNGGDWCWFGGRMIQALIQYGYISEAYRELRPMVERVRRTGGFHEWWSRDNQPRGSGEFRGSAGVLGRAIELLQAWAESRLAETRAAAPPPLIAAAVEFFVSPSGNDAGDGTRDKPFATLGRAQQAARASAGKEPVTVWLRGGTYYLPAPLIFTAEDSGTRNAPVTWQAFPGETPTLSGGAKLDLKWEPFRDGIFKAGLPAGSVSDQLFVNGERQPMARYPNYDPSILVYGGYAADCISPERAARWADPEGGFIHAMHAAEWGDYHYRITGKKPDGTLAYEGGWQNNRQMGMHKDRRFVENIFEELDVAGEWFLDNKTATLYFYPPPGLKLTGATIEIVRLRQVIEFQGSREQPVKFLTLRGITVRHTARTFMDNKEPLLRSDWTTYRGGAIYLHGAEDCALEDCFLDQVGGNAVFVSGYNRRIGIRGCHIAKAGANGVAFVGGPRAVRNPLFEYKQRQEYQAIDQTPGPKAPDYPGDCQVEDCLIYQSGRVEKQTAPIQIAMAQNITVRHCSIYDVPRAGINIGDGCWGGHLVEFCDVFDTVKETGDHGSFNSWGRDRYWGLKNAPEAELARLALLDTTKPIVLRNNRWRCDHGWDVDLDDGSSNYEIYNNLLLHGGLKLREGFHRRVGNNITLNNSFHPHVWYEQSGDIVTNNIWMGAYRPAAMSEDLKLWGQEVDRNLFATSESDRDRFKSKGCDLHSLVGDPFFVAPAKGDFQVREGSPALRLGFRNFPMDQFGVQKPPLRAIARTPEMPQVDRAKPDITTTAAGQSATAPSLWLEARVRNLEGEEYSAFGVARESGGILLSDVPARSAAARHGFQNGDLIQSVDGQPARSVHELFRLQGAVAGKALVIGFVRGQQRKQTTIERAAPGSARYHVIAFYTGKDESAHISFVEEAKRWFGRMAADHNFSFESTTDWNRLNLESLAEYQAVLFLDSRPEVPAQREAFRKYMENGGGWMGFHFAGFALTPSKFPQNWDWYHEDFLGAGSYAGNTWKPTSAILKVEDRHHPATVGLPETFTASPNEWYKWTCDLRTNRNIRILASIDPTSFPLGTGPKQHEIWSAGYYPVVWTNRKYRMVYFNTGHNDMDFNAKPNKELSFTFGNEVQDKLVLNALEWLGTGKKQPQTK
jgi:hypothetical protein